MAAEGASGQKDRAAGPSTTGSAVSRGAPDPVVTALDGAGSGEPGRSALDPPAGAQGAPTASRPDRGDPPRLSVGSLHRLQRGAPSDEEMPRAHVTRRQAVAAGLFVLSAVAFLYFVLPKLSGPNGLGSTWRRVESGNGWWVLAAVALEVLSFAGYVALFRAVFIRGYGRVGWRESYEITMSGLAASRLFAAAGAGGLALTAWALRRSGMEARVVACRMVAFTVLLYVIYAGSMLLDGVGLRTGLFPGGGSFAITIIPAVVAALLLGGAGAVALLPRDVERRLERWASGSGRVAGWVARALTGPALAASGVRTAIALVRTRDPLLLGAPAWWGFDICVLWASFHAFGNPPPFTVIWMAYFVGMLGNLLPLPGGVGGVDGGMIGALAAFGVDLNLAVVSVLVYRGIAFWLPTLPGAVAYLQLRRTVTRWADERRSEPAREAAAARGTS